MKLFPTDEARNFVNEAFNNFISDTKDEVMVAILSNAVSIADYLFKKDLGILVSIDFLIIIK